MTTGSWFVGQIDPFNKSSCDYAERVWNGGNGKTEAWAGGIRPKWNNYSLYRQKVSKTCIPASWGDYVHWIKGPIDKTEATARADVGWSVNDDLRLLAKLAENIRGHSFDLGINIAEGKESYKTIVGNLRSLGGALVSLKHGRVSNAFRYLGVTGRRNALATRRLSAKDISGRWLEMQYAWMPLVSQSYEAAKALKAVTGYRKMRFSASLGAKRTTYECSSQPAVYTYRARLSYSARYIAELYEDISLNRSLGLVDPVQIAWEVVPYSFVVDWFLPIGTYLSAWQMIPKLKGRFIYTQRIGHKSMSLRCTLKSPIVGENWRYGSATERFEMFRTSRTVSNSLSVPFPTFNSPPKALSPRRIYNAVALIHQLLK